MAHPDASGRLRGTQVTETNVSKPRAHVRCVGINQTNGLPCRNPIAASRVIPLCHLHREQETAVTSTGPDRQAIGHSVSAGQQPGHHEFASSNTTQSTTLSSATHKPLLPGDVYHTRISSSSYVKDQASSMGEESTIVSSPQQGLEHNNKTPFPGSSMMQLTSNVSALQLSTREEPSNLSVSQLEDVTKKGKRVPVSRTVSHSTTLDRAETDRIHQKNTQILLSNSFGTLHQSDSPSPKRHKGKKFSIANLLRSLGCVPVRDASDTKARLKRRDTGDSSKAVHSPTSAFPPPAKVERLVPRKAVDFRPAEQVVQENKIKKDRAEIERIISAQRADATDEAALEPGIIKPPPLERGAGLLPGHQVDMVGCVRSDLQPYRDPQFIKCRMTGPQRKQYFLARYTNHIDYPHKSERAHKKLTEVVTSIVNASVMASFSVDEVRAKEYVYIFRLDGDYAYTPTISLKIGRSKDVDARLRQWYAQCRYKIDRLDQFQTQHAILLERMLHLEFEEDRVLKQCRCGRTHREWFDIRRDDARGRIRRAYLKWSSFADEVQALRGRS